MLFNSCGELTFSPETEQYCWGSLSDACVELRVVETQTIGVDIPSWIMPVCVFSLLLKYALRTLSLGLKCTHRRLNGLWEFYLLTQSCINMASGLREPMLARLGLNHLFVRLIGLILVWRRPIPHLPNLIVESLCLCKFYHKIKLLPLESNTFR
jgi:hypothetical protein